MNAPRTHADARSRVPVRRGAGAVAWAAVLLLVPAAASLRAQDPQSSNYRVEAGTALGGGNGAADPTTINPRYPAQSPGYTLRAVIPGHAAVADLPPTSAATKAYEGPIYRGRRHELFEPPAVVSAVLRDTDGSGGIDRAVLTFDKALADASLDPAGFALDGQPASAQSEPTALDHVLWLDFAPELPGTGLKQLTYKAAVGGLTDATQHPLADFGAAAMVEIDGAAPVVLLTAPAPGATIKVPAVLFSLSETAASGRLRWTWTAGNPDPAAPHVVVLGAGDLTAGSHGPLTGSPAPALVEGATYTVTVEATDGAALTGAAQAAGVTYATLAITTLAVPNGQVGSAYSTPLAATGGYGARSWALSAGTIPAGLALGASDGVLAGAPTAPGTYTFTVEVRDAGSPQQVASRAFTVTTAPSPPALTSGPPPAGKVAQPYSFFFTASGGQTPYAWAASSLPPGMALNSSTGELRSVGPSDPPTAGSYPATITVTDAQSPPGTAQQSVTIVIAPKDLTIQTASLASVKVGQAASRTLLADGGTPPYVWALVSGGLPAGLGLDTGAGLLSGTPQGPAGTASFTLRVTDAATAPQSAERTFSLTVAPADLLFTTVSLPDAVAGLGYSATFTASGGQPAYTWALMSGALPAGVGLTADGVLSGTPGAGAAGSYNFTVRVTDQSPPTPQAVQRSFGLTVQPPGLAITTTALPGGLRDVAYSATVATLGGTAPRTLALFSGSLPAGLALAGDTGAISGTPAATGTSTFTLRATDTAGATADRTFTITVTLPTPNVILTLASETGLALPEAAATVAFSVSGSPAPHAAAGAERRYFLQNSGESVTVQYPGFLPFTAGPLSYASAALTLNVRLAYPLGLTIVDEAGGALSGETVTLSTDGALTADAATGDLRFYRFTGAAGQTATVRASGYVAQTTAPLATGAAPVRATVALAPTLKVLGADQGAGQPVALDTATFGAFGFTLIGRRVAGGAALLFATPGTGVLTVEVPGFELASRSVTVDGSRQTTVDFDDGFPGAFAAELDGPKLVPTNFNVTLHLVDELGLARVAANAEFTFDRQGPLTPDRRSGQTASFTLDPLLSPQTCTIRLPGFVTVTTAPIAYAPDPAVRTVTFRYNVKVVSARDETGRTVPLSGAPFSATGFTLAAQTCKDGVGYVAARPAAGGAGSVLLLAPGFAVSGLSLTPAGDAVRFVSYGAPVAAGVQALAAAGAFDPATQTVTEGPPVLYAVRLQVEDERGGALPAQEAGFRFGVTGARMPDVVVGAAAYFAMPSGNSGETCTVTVPGFQPVTTNALAYLTAQQRRTVSLPYSVRVIAARDAGGNAVPLAADALSVEGPAVPRATVENGVVYLAVTPGSGELVLRAPGYLEARAPLVVSAFARLTAAFDGAPGGADVVGPALTAAVKLTVRGGFGGALDGLSFAFSSDGARASAYQQGQDYFFAPAQGAGQTVQVRRLGATTATSAPLAFSALQGAQATLTCDFPLVVIGATKADGTVLDLASLTFSAQGLVLHGTRLAADGTSVGLFVEPGTGSLGANHPSAGSAVAPVTTTDAARKTVDFDVGAPGAFAAEFDGPAVDLGGADLFKVTLRVVDDFGAALDPAAPTYYFTGHQAAKTPDFLTAETAAFSLDPRFSGEDVVLTRGGYIETRVGPLDYADQGVARTVTLPYAVRLRFFDGAGAPVDCAGFTYQFPGVPDGPATATAGHEAGFALPAGASGAFTVTAPGFLTTATEPLTVDGLAAQVRDVTLTPSVRVLGATNVRGEALALADAQLTAEGLMVRHQRRAADGTLAAAVTPGSGTLKLTVRLPGETQRWFAKREVTVGADAVLEVDFDAEAADLPPGVDPASRVEFGAALDGPPVVGLLAVLEDSDADGRLDTARLEFPDPVDSAALVAAEFALGGKPASGFVADAPARLTLRFFNPQVAGTAAAELTYQGTGLRFADGTAHPAIDAAFVAERDAAPPVVLLVTGLDEDGNRRPERVIVQLSEPLAVMPVALADWVFTDAEGVQLDLSRATATQSGDALIFALPNDHGMAGALGYRYAPADPARQLVDASPPRNPLRPGDTTPPAAPVVWLPHLVLTEVGITTPLDGRESYDPNGAPDVLSWVWAEHPGNPATGLLQAVGADPAAGGATEQRTRRAQITPPAPGRYRFTFTVTDRGGLSGAAELFVVAQAGGKLAPRAFPLARPAQLTLGGAGPQVFDVLGAFSRDPDGAGRLAYRWELAERPAGSALELTVGQQSASGFQLAPDRGGRYLLRLTVTDEEDEGWPSAPEELELRVLDRRTAEQPALPARAQPVLVWADDGDDVLETGESCTLDAGDLANPDGGGVQYAWRQRFGPEPLWLGVRGEPRVTFRPRAPGRYRVELRLRTAAGQESVFPREFRVFRAQGGAALTRRAALSTALAAQQELVAKTLDGNEQTAPFALAALFDPPAPEVEADATPVALRVDGAPAGARLWWVQELGPPARLADRTAAATQAYFSEPGTYRFRVEVEDVEGDRAAAVASAEVRVQGRNQPPVALAVVTIASPSELGQLVTLSGASSTDPAEDADGLTAPTGFLWYQTEGPEVPLVDATGATLSLRPAQPGTYRFALIVDDGQHVSQPHQVSFSVQAPPPPVVEVPVETIAAAAGGGGGGGACARTARPGASDDGVLNLLGPLAALAGLLLLRRRRE